MDSWSSFENFLADMGEAPQGMSIERIDNDGPYSKANCRWATQNEQTRNRATCRYYELDGLTLMQKDWERRLGLSTGTICGRLKSGWPMRAALTTPKGGRKP